jgi:hypothetical protein
MVCCCLHVFWCADAGVAGSGEACCRQACACCVLRAGPHKRQDVTRCNKMLAGLLPPSMCGLCILGRAK